MNKKIIIITGYLASGKSAFAVRLAKELCVPYITKDTLKEAICSGFTLGSREESSRFSAITFDAILYISQRLMETGSPLIIEGNFVPAGVKKTDEAGALKNLIDRYEYLALTYKFYGNTSFLHKRFTEREHSPERGQALRMLSDFSFDDFNRACHNLDPFDVGGCNIEVDATDFSKVDFCGYISIARDFIKCI